MIGTAILVVDDNEAARYAKMRALRQAGFDVHEAGTAEQALDAVATLRPRLVVLDVHLPDRSGWEVCETLKSNPETESTLVLQVSATFVTSPDTVRALEAGADGCLTEPIEAPVLIATVRALLRARRAEDALRQALARELEARHLADAANRTKDEFLALLSHELRSPLGAILNWATLLRGGGVPQTGIPKALESIERNARLQGRLIDDLLDVSSIIAGKMRIEPSVIHLPAIVHNSLESLRPAAKAKGIDLSATIDPTVGPLVADPNRIQQVVWNLLSNAVKFTESGQVEVHVVAVTDGVEIRVTDSGRGIAPDFLPYIFDRFRQGDSSTTRAQGGLGLGLSIVRHLVELHGGRVEASSPGPGKGSTFRVRLPLPQTPTVHEANAGMAEMVRLAGVRMLVVDDVEDERAALAVTLGHAGAEVVVAGDAEEAIGRYLHAPFDVILSDIAMPHMDGFSLIHRIRNSVGVSGQRPIAIAVTAYTGAEDSLRMLEAGFDAHLRKPIDPVELTSTIARLLGRPTPQAL